MKVECIHTVLYSAQSNTVQSINKCDLKMTTGMMLKTQ